MTDEVTADELALEGARTLLETAPMARLAYAGIDGFPRVIPIGFFWNGRALVFATAVTSPKVRALSERPEVAVTIDVGATAADAESLLIRGSAQLETIDGIPEEYIAASAKTLSPDEVEAFRENVAQMYDRMLRIVVVPTWARYFDFGGGRLPAFLRHLAESKT
jgi:nitroimidazol reductase NimA-like FMN-containing flavoprotein (pyridoxamine 5'-phosphate oxidase superfamily)